MLLKDFIQSVNNSQNVCKSCIENANNFNHNYNKFKVQYEEYNNTLTNRELNQEFIFGKPYKTK